MLDFIYVGLVLWAARNAKQVKISKLKMKNWKISIENFKKSIEDFKIKNLLLKVKKVKIIVYSGIRTHSPLITGSI